MNGSVMFVEICGLSITEGAAAVTVMASLVPAGVQHSVDARCLRKTQRRAQPLRLHPAKRHRDRILARRQRGETVRAASPVMVVRVPCNSGEEIVTTTPGNALPSAESRCR